MRFDSHSPSTNCSYSISFFSLQKHQSIPEVDVKDYAPSAWWGVNNDWSDEMSKYPTLKKLFTSNNIQERYWINQCWESLQDKNLIVLSRLTFQQIHSILS